jgi:riboflavin kinase / FMN adenylyltransferase
MKIYEGLHEYIPNKHAVVTTGTFDGVHLGHKKIIRRLNEIAKDNNGESVIITFDPHPRSILFPEQKDLKLLSDKNEKIQLLKDAGVQNLIIIEFTKAFSEISSLDFIKNIIIDKIQTKHLVIGYDHKFGKNREGSFDYLKNHADDFGFKLEEISAKLINENNISSSKIRKALEQGELSAANKYLGYDYFLSGSVVTGKQIGRTIGFPTANLRISDPLKLIPSVGVYAVKVLIGNNIYKGMLNVGYNPTVTDEKIKTIEVNILEFNRDIYGEFIKIFFIERMRDEMKFSGLPALKEQLALDRINALNILS